MQNDSYISEYHSALVINAKLAKLSGCIIQYALLFLAAIKSKGIGSTCEKLTSIQYIEVQFAKMTSRIKQALINSNVDVVSLIEQLCAISAVKNKKVPLFDEDVFEKIQTINELWRKLRIFWNIFDYELLQYVVEISDCKEAEEIFKEFLLRIDPSVIEDVDLVLHCREEHQEGFLKPVLRIKVNSEKCTLSIKKQVEKIVSQAYKLEKYALRFHSIKEGCIELLYYISKPLKLYITQFNVSEGVLAELFAYKFIISLHIDDLELKAPTKITDTMHTVSIASYVVTHAPIILIFNACHNIIVKSLHQFKCNNYMVKYATSYNSHHLMENSIIMAILVYCSQLLDKINVL